MSSTGKWYRVKSGTYSRYEDDRLKLYKKGDLVQSGGASAAIPERFLDIFSEVRPNSKVPAQKSPQPADMPDGEVAAEQADSEEETPVKKAAVVKASPSTIRRASGKNAPGK